MSTKSTDRINLKQWLELKPYSQQTSTDKYYVELANKVKNVLTKKQPSAFLNEYLNEDEIDILCCFLVSYLEDIVTGSNIWNTFTKKHFSLYKKYLPFFPLENYILNNVNMQDVNFLIWYFLNTIQQNFFISPINEEIMDMAFEVKNILSDEYKYAPENPILKSYYQLNRDETNYFSVRGLIELILFNTYLFYPDTYIRFKKENEKEQKNKQKSVDKDREAMLFYEIKDNFINTSNTSLLAMTGKEWAAELLGENHPLYKDIINISPKVKGFFLYKGQDKNNIFIEHIASGRKFEMTKKSYEHYNDLKKVDTILLIGIVKWRGEWWFSGTSSKMDYNKKLIEDIKHTLAFKQTVNFLDFEEFEGNKLIKDQMMAFLNVNNGSFIAFMKRSQVNEFIEKVTNCYNEELNISEDEKERFEKNAKQKKDLKLEKEEEISADELDDPCIVFFNPHSGIEIAVGINSAFPMKNNPFFQPEESETDFWQLLLSNVYSAELVQFCLDTCKNNLPFLRKKVWKTYLKDIDFLLRFLKVDSYHSKPEITFL